MGEARARRLLGLPPRGLKPAPDGLIGQQRHVLAMIDRRIERKDAETVFEDHSAKPGNYVSADMRTLYKWDGVKLQRIDRLARKADNSASSHP